jgi:hypothetical protein
LNIEKLGLVLDGYRGETEIGGATFLSFTFENFGP